MSTGPNNFYRIVGNPDLGLVEGVMIGIRNTKDDGVPRCAEVWVNELRVNGFDERGGYAGRARLDISPSTRTDANDTSSICLARRLRSDTVKIPGSRGWSV